MKFDRSEPGIVVSGVAHVALLVAALVAFADTQRFDDATEAVAVELVTPSQLSEMTKGERTAPVPVPEPRPRADQVADKQELKPEAVELKRDVPVDAPPPPPARDLQAEAEAKQKAEAEAKVRAEAEKAAAAEAARAEAEKAAAAAARARAEARAKAEAEKVAKAEAEAKARAEAEAKAQEALEKAAAERARVEAAARAKAEAEAKAREEARLEAEQKRREAEAKARAEEQQKKKEAELAKAREEQKRKEQERQRLAALATEQAKPVPPRPDPKPSTNFDPSAIEKLLTSKEKPAAAPSTAAQTNRTASLGTSAATGQRLNPSQRDSLGSLLKEQISACWSPPTGIGDGAGLRPRVRMSINPDGSLAAEPVLMNPSADPIFRSMAESALRAIRRCAPFRIPAQYAPMFNDWRDWSITFDAKEMLG